MRDALSEPGKVSFHTADLARKCAFGDVLVGKVSGLK